MKIGNYVSISEVAQQLEVSNDTIFRWYQWYEDDSFEKPEDLVLPKYVYLDKRRTKFFHINDVDLLKDFKKSLGKDGKYRGVMAKYNSYFWSNSSPSKHKHD